MLTPRFELSQTDDDVTIVIHAPFANIKDTLVEVNKTDFRMYATPYYLRLNFPGEVVEDDDSTGKYDCDSGDFIFKFSKVHKGELFPNLDMITSLLAPSKKTFRLTTPTIEVISNPYAVENEENIKEEEEEKVEVNCEESHDNIDSGDEWFVNQNPVIADIQVSLQPPKYGFGNKISGALASFEQAWISEIIDLPMPDKTLLKDRKTLREQNEKVCFDENHYMADLMETEFVEPCLNYVCEWENLTEEDVCFTNDEKDLLKELPNKEYLLDDKEVKIVLYSMVDILFASCYNCRTTQGENTSESGWTINKLSSTLSWFQSFENINDVVLSCIRRSLCFPQIRNWKLSMKIFEDLKKVIKLGKKYIIKQFCEIHSIFNTSNEPRYILNQLYIKDYLIWLQQISNTRIEEISSLLENVNIEKDDLGLYLSEIEVACHSVQNEETDDMICHFENLTTKDFSQSTEQLGPTSDSSSDSDTDSTSSSSSSDTSSSDSTTNSSSASDSVSRQSNASSSDSTVNALNSSSNSTVVSKISPKIISELDSDDEPN